MEMEHILKQVDWLDEERRKDKTKIGSLEERLSAIEENYTSVAHKAKDLEDKVTRLDTLTARMDSFDEALLKLRLDNKQQFEEIEKQGVKREDERDKIRRAELRSLENAIAATRKDLDQLTEIRRNLQGRVEEENRLSRVIDDVRNKLEAMRREEEENTRTIRLIDDSRRQDMKRMTDLQGEVTALRKRMDDQRGRLELTSSTLKKVETHVNELSTVETERREAMTKFLDNQAMKDVERERVWKEWQTRFQIIESQAAEAENTLQTLDATQQSIKRSQQSVEDLSQKVDRRISEITEMQRLAEERFRQEWVTFKADDQKRWTNYTLTMEEQRGETMRQHEKLAEKVTHLEDEFQEVQDLLQQMADQTEKRLQSLLAQTHEWVTSFERTVGRAR